MPLRSRGGGVHMRVLSVGEVIPYAVETRRGEWEFRSLRVDEVQRLPMGSRYAGEILP